jgi:hypothetical protein
MCRLIFALAFLGLCGEVVTLGRIVMAGVLLFIKGRAAVFFMIRQRVSSLA